MCATDGLTGKVVRITARRFRERSDSILQLCLVYDRWVRKWDGGTQGVFAVHHTLQQSESTSACTPSPPATGPFSVLSSSLLLRLSWRLASSLVRIRVWAPPSHRFNRRPIVLQRWGAAPSPLLPHLLPVTVSCCPCKRIGALQSVNASIHQQAHDTRVPRHRALAVKRVAEGRLWHRRWVELVAMS